ncbi:MAG TPA: redox-regulated ATPase YchF [Patescibacteria group bacterium]|nr:redox-regulated ATPase YchF [Patescibacteria group bacterium]
MLKIGILGLANVGKSTLFNALQKEAKAEVSNYPFCTIESNVGIVEVPDERLDELQKILKVPKKIPAPIKFIDIAGLIKGAAKGEGLGNKFLANIRETDAIMMVLRAFTDSKIVSTQNEVNPEKEYETIKTELILKDLETCEKRLASVAKDIKAGEKLARIELEILRKIKAGLNEEKLISDLGLETDDLEIISSLNFLTQKPVLVVLNCDEKDLKNPPFIRQLPEERQIEIAAITEAELSEFSDQERLEYLKDLGLAETGLTRLIRASFHLLNLIVFYTYTDPSRFTRAETKGLVQSWPIPKNSTAVSAAGQVHSDFAQKFIKAEILSFDDLKKSGSLERSKSKGQIRLEGKNYQVCDADIIKFII